MSMNRRSFMQSILALAAAPAVVRASSIMRVRPVLGPFGAVTWDVSAPMAVQWAFIYSSKGLLVGEMALTAKEAVVPFFGDGALIYRVAWLNRAGNDIELMHPDSAPLRVVNGTLTIKVPS